nr:MAG TPA: hypothetical protein [Caudoviricetes sp.]
MHTITCTPVSSIYQNGSCSLPSPSTTCLA